MKLTGIKRLIPLLCFYPALSYSVAQTSERDSLLALYTNQEGKDLVQSLNDLSWIYKNIDVDSSMYFASLALDESEHLNDDMARASSYNSIASAHEAKGQLDSALVYHNKSLAIKVNSPDSTAIGNSYNNLGIVYDELGQHEKSLIHYYEALKYYESSAHDPLNIAMVLGNIGIVLKKQKQYEKVLEYYQQALSIYQEAGSDFGIAVTNGNIGSLYIQLKQYEESIRYSEQSMEGYQALGYSRYVPYSMHNMAIAYDSLNEYTQAETLYQQSLALHIAQENNYEIASVFINLAQNQLQQGNFWLSIEYSGKALDYARLSSSPEFLVRAMKIQAQSYAALGQYVQAYQQLLTSTVGQDSLFEKDKTRAIVELETKYETSQKEQQIALQQATIREKDLVIDRDRILLSSFGAVILLVIGVAVAVWRKEKWKQAKMDEEIKAQRARDQMSAVISSQENERKRFAADIHDGFGQLISVLKINLSNLDKVGRGNSAGQSRQELYEGSVKIIDEMYAELRNVCFNIMPQTLVKHGLPAALKEFADRLNATRSIRTEILVYDIDDRLEDIQEISLYRITQEVVNNILKYANASNITIQLTQDESEITLMIEDDGNGFDPIIMQSGKGNGWKNLITRTNFINGQFEHDSTPGIQGTTFVLNLPIGSITYEADTVMHG
jgi:signal transduction histidine kinase